MAELHKFGCPNMPTVSVRIDGEKKAFEAGYLFLNDADAEYFRKNILIHDIHGKYVDYGKVSVSNNPVVVSAPTAIQNGFTDTKAKAVEAALEEATNKIDNSNKKDDKKDNSDKKDNVINALKGNK